MCGVAGFHIHNPDKIKFSPAQLAGNLLLGIESRGQDATGYLCVAQDGVQTIRKASTRATEFLKGWRPVPNDAQTVLLHTRYATQGHQAFPENNHPVSCGPVHCVHNGHIYNDDSIFRELEIERTGAVDSEAIAAVIAGLGFRKGLPKALNKLDGAFAIAAVHDDHPGQVILAKGDYSPLIYVSNGNVTVWASERQAIERAWRAAIGKVPSGKKFVWMTAGNILRIKDGHLHKEEFETMWKPVSTGWKSSPQNGGYVGWTTAPRTTKVGNHSIVPVERPLQLNIPTGRDDLLSGHDPDPRSLTGAVSMCECCGEWVPVNEIEVWAEENICWKCWESLVESDVL